ncbi:hypothetical protein BCD48_42060 [Pseudofrankia sp. BMG5.36]|nr:hypothetical protein BCD48_42060 [Pseudofrankia sp. BMG5.36]
MTRAVFFCLDLTIDGMIARYADYVIESFETDFIECAGVHVKAVEQRDSILIGVASSTSATSVAGRGVSHLPSP